ncbi:MAG: SIS domain-containing protein [Candidatus Marinimicrobia bacterium]|nr:SIS domain-containing protein [Candidatus Neomarinimicrobiota bacterium]
MNNVFEESFAILEELRRDTAFTGKIQKASNIMLKALKEGKKILWCGNGGSAADCQHLSAELLARLRYSRKALASLALTTDTSFLTAWINDTGRSDQLFSRQIEALAGSGDVLVAISTSGNSDNIINALYSAKEKDTVSIFLGGAGGGKAAGIADLELIVPSDNTQRIQEIHIMIGHMICENIEKAFL